MTSGDLNDYVIILLEKVNREMVFWWKYMLKVCHVIFAI